MKKILPLALLFLLISACRQDTDPSQKVVSTGHQLQVLADDQPEWQYENLRLYPVIAKEAFIQKNAAAAQLIPLRKAIATYGFRISEKKPYGRFDDNDAVNKLTVQNKTQDPVFLLSGDIVQGGRQDRVVGEDQVIAARSLQDIPVFCVEKGRWNYQNPTEEDLPANPKNDKTFAFSGYYHVASGDIRQTLVSNKSQEEVWEKVSHLTKHHETGSLTGTYTSLENSQSFTQQRDAYLRFFSDKFSDRDDLVGVIAVSGNSIIGGDIFGHPDLFRQQISSLLHSYATDAISRDEPVGLNEAQVHRQEAKINRAASGNHALHHQGALVHFYLDASGTK